MRRIKNRVFDLEAATTATGAASAAGQRMLIEIIGRRDALFWPWRYVATDCDFTHGSLIRERQNAFLERREGISVKADGQRDWKSASATRLELAGAKLVEPIFSSGQVQSLLLTDLGEALGRALVGPRLKNLDQAALVFSRLLQCEATGQKLVGEGRLFGKSLVGNPNDWEAWFEPVLPLLTSGAVVANSDTQGRVVLSSKTSTLPKAVKFDVEPLEDGDALYLAAFENERATLAKLSGGCDIYIPMPAMAGL